MKKNINTFTNWWHELLILQAGALRFDCAMAKDFFFFFFFACQLSIIEMMGPYQSCVQYPVLLLCCGLMLMGCSPGLACDVWCELPRRYHWARPFGLSKGRDGLGGFCANNSWVYMVGSVQIDTICFPISRLAIEYKAHNQRQRARSTLGT